MKGFADDFIWGAASSAYQIEGYPTEDGGGRSVWDEFCSHPGNIYENEDGSIAADAYHRYEEDLDLLKEIGLKAYRFSISWARVDPLGDGTWIEKGLAYYDRVIDACLARGIEPYVTLHHWDLPQAVEDRGGWLKRETPEAFARFAGKCASRFGTRVKNYFTLNEVQIILMLGYKTGVHAPGKQLPQDQLFLVWKNLLIAHGLSMREVKAAAPHAMVSFASTGCLCYPETDSAADREAARVASFALNEDNWAFSHSMALDPIILGDLSTCPGDFAQVLADQLTADDMRTIHVVPDILGVNVYNGNEIRAGEDGRPAFVPRPAGFPRTALKWPITPRVMNEGLVNLWERYRVPLMVTEDGLSCNDKIYLDGKVHDPDRIDFLSRYLDELSKATKKADIRGYFHWSLTDNFEWNSGYAEHFGLIYVDYPTQRRILKDSAYWLKGKLSE